MKSKINTETQDVLQLLSREVVVDTFGEAAASLISKDKITTWAKFILTDDKPNGNKQRVPIEEFDNLIKTGLYKPVKMAVGEINDSHDYAEPLGVITHLAKDGNKIVALAALWDSERRNDVALIRDRVDSGKPVNVSWEILYSDSIQNGGYTDLLDTVLTAVTIVGLPAYAGRTPILAIAAKKTKWSDSYIKSLPDTHFLYVDGNERLFPYRDDSGKIDVERFNPLMEEIAESSLPENLKKTFRHQIKKLSTMIATDASLAEILGVDESMEDTLELKELESRVKELESELNAAKASLTEKETALAKASEDLNTANESLTSLEAEIQPLREFKEEADKAKEREDKLASIKEEFVASGLEKTEEYFSENAEKLLAMDEEALKFMLQEMVAFGKEIETSEGQASLRKGAQVPNFSAESTAVSVSDLAAALRARNKK